MVFSLRAVATRREGYQTSDSLNKYQQATFGLGYIGIANDLVNLLRCAIVNPTFGHERWDEAPASISKDTHFRTPEVGEEDHPIQRRNMRTTAGWVSLAFLASNVPGIIAGTMFHKDNFGDAHKARRVASLRYASSGVALFLIAIIVVCTAWSQRNQRRACLKALYTTYALAGLTVSSRPAIILPHNELTLLVEQGMVAVYRLTVMWNDVPYLEYTGPGSLTSVPAKVTFYMFHALPEWVAITGLLGLPIRKIYGTGFWGDWRAKDDTEKQIAKRRAKQERKDAEKEAQGALEAGNKEGVELQPMSSTNGLIR